MLHADAGDAFLSAGQKDVADKEAYSRGVKSTDGEAKQPADPNDNFNSAYESYQAAATSTDLDVQARAYYGSGLAQEYLATVAAKDSDVESAVEKAKELYKKATEVSTDSPYRALANKALANLDNSLTLDYYKSVSNAFVNLPEPSDESILSENNDELNAGEAIGVEGFNTNDDPSEMEQDTSEMEETVSETE